MSNLDYPVFPIFAFLGFVISIIPLPWHFQAWNSGTCYYMIWTSLSCLNQFVNSVVWNGNALNPAPVWCDISIRIMMGASVGIPAASLCINRRLYKIASVQAVTVTRAEKRRAIMIDTMICVLFPLVFIALQYVVQGHRFDIYEDIGCYPFIYNTIVAFFISDIWPVVIGLISAVYCALSLRAFYRQRIQFSEFLSSNTSLTMSRYFRLMALAMTEMLCTVPMGIFLIWINATAEPIEPWVSWENTHYDFSRVGQYPAVIWMSSYLVVIAVQLTRWAVVACAFIFFGYFGFAAEARRHYSIALRFVLKRLGISSQFGRSTARSSTGSRRPAVVASESLPIYVIKDHSEFSRGDSLSAMDALEEKLGFSSPLKTTYSSAPPTPTTYNEHKEDIPAS